MTHLAPPASAVPGGDPGRQVASLREILLLVRDLAGTAVEAVPDAMLDEAATISGLYERASPVAQRRFDGQAAEVAAWAAAGVEALLASGVPPSASAARRLAERLDQSLERLGDSLSA
jgi:hypothetical protein